MKVRPIRVRLVRGAHARKVAVPAFDAMSSAEREALRQANPRTFLHALHEQPGDPDAAISRSVAGLSDLLDRDLFEPAGEGVFIYRMGEGERQQVAVIAEMTSADMTADVLPHEDTKTERVAYLRAYADAIGYMSSPVALAHPRSDEVDDALRGTMRRAPLLDFVSQDGLRQTVWRVPRPDDLIAALGRIERAYITDGHHRVASAAASGPDTPVIVALMSVSTLDVLEFNRVISGVDIGEVLGALNRPQRLVDDAWRPTPVRGEVLLAQDGRWWRAALPQPHSDDVADVLDAATLHTQVLTPLGVMPDDERLSYVPGTLPLGTLAAEQSECLVIGLAPVSFDDVIAVARAGRTMPPKSTYFRPKPRSGIFLHAVR